MDCYAKCLLESIEAGKHPWYLRFAFHFCCCHLVILSYNNNSSLNARAVCVTLLQRLFNVLVYEITSIFQLLFQQSLFIEMSQDFLKKWKLEPKAEKNNNYQQPRIILILFFLTKHKNDLMWTLKLSSVNHFFGLC